jgi:hypothetical protein
MKSTVIIVKFHTRLESTDFVVVLVLVLVPWLLYNSDFEDKYEKNQIKSHVYALRPQPYTMQIV